MYRAPIVLSLLFSIHSGSAQQYVFLRHTPEDGLAQSQVRCMTQDASGHLWFGTLGGASRFDGVVFDNYALQEGLPDAQVNALCAMPDGSLWMGAGGKLVHHEGGRIQVVELPSSTSNARVNSLVIGPQGALVAGTAGGGVLLQDGEAFVPLPGFPADTADQVRTLLALPDDGLLIGGRNGLLHWQNGSCRPVVLGDERPRSISSLALGSDGSWWIGTFGDGLYRLKPGGAQLNWGERDGLLQNNVRHVLVGQDGKVWVSTKFGVNLIVPGEERHMRAFTVHQGMPNDNIWCAFEDGEGNLWLGTDGAGALRYAGDRFVTFTVKDGLCSDQVMCFVEDELGDVWMGTYGSGICRMDGMAQVTTFEGLRNNTVWCGLRDRSGRLWFGTSDGLCSMEQGIVSIPEEATALLGQRVLSLAEGPDGTLWAGTRDGLTALRPDGSVLSFNGEAEGPGRSVRGLAFDEKGSLWCGTDAGLVRYDGRTFRKWSMAQGLGDNTVFCVLPDTRGRIWAGTSNGLICLDGDSVRNHRLGSDFGSNYINFLTATPEGHLWAGTNNGIYRIRPEGLLAGDHAPERAGISDGMGSLECNLNASFVDQRGRLFFGTSGGVVFHDPARWTDSSSETPPRLLITGVRSFLQESDWKGRSDGIDPRTGLPLGLRLAYRRNYLTFDYTGISLSAPERVRYRYMLVGQDQDWLPVTDARFASYSNLRQGEYTFMVIARGRNGRWSDPATFSFHIAPPWWLTWWAFTLGGLVLAGSAFGIHRYRSVSRRRHERTRQLMLRSRMLQLEQQALNANMNRHFIFNALNSIQYYINRQDRTAANRYLTSFAKLIRKNLDASQSDTTTLAEELERLELYLVLEHMRFKDKFRYQVDRDPAVDATRVRIPAMMLQPYVENSIWHGILPMDQQGTVRIQVHGHAQDRIRVTISDDGIGLTESFNRKAARASDHISRGIEITKGRTDVLRNLHLSDIRIQGPEEVHGPDGEVTGTRVIIDLPRSGPTGTGSGGLRSGTS